MTLTCIHCLSDDTGSGRIGSTPEQMGMPLAGMPLRGAAVRRGGWRRRAGSARERASEVGGAAARVGTRAGACERVLFVTLCHSSKYAFIKVFACGDLCLGVRVSSALPILRFSDREEPQGPHSNY